MQRALNWNESNIKKQLEQVKQREMPSKETGADKKVLLLKLQHKQNPL